MYGATRYIGFPFPSSCISSFIQCAALLLDLDKVHIDMKMQQKLNSRLVRSVKYSKIGINEALELMNSIIHSLKDTKYK